MYLINLLEKWQINYLEELYSWYIECFEDLFKSMKVITICPYQENQKINIKQDVTDRLEKKWIFFLAYNDLGSRTVEII